MQAGSIPKYALPLAATYATAVVAGFYFDLPWLALFPIAMIFAWLAFKRMDVLMLCLMAFVPLSMSLEDLEIGGLGIYLPTEPILAGVLVLFILRSLRGWPIDPRILRHPLARWTALGMVWMFLTAITSEIPVVSFKFLVARLWFVVGFMWVLGHIILKDPLRKHQMIMAYAIPLCAVIIYTVIRHAEFGFEKDAGHWVMKPFYKDHTSYGAVLAMIIPPVIALATWKRFSAFTKVSLIGILAILSLGLVLSYTRAAWVSLAAVTVLWALIKLGFRLKTLVTIAVIFLSFVWFARDALLIQLERNRQDSSDNLTEHVESISNVSSDASNLERLNRWNAALALFQERPIFGWGGGTYQFVYAPFQRSDDRTIISTNNADGGNAHSEYLGPLAEQGVPGFIFILGLLGFCMHLGFRLNRKLKAGEDRALAMGVFLGLMTYFVHGILNNYLDTDKASALFWGYFAMLLVWDLTISASTDQTMENGGLSSNPQLQEPQ